MKYRLQIDSIFPSVSVCSSANSTSTDIYNARVGCEARAASASYT